MSQVQNLKSCMENALAEGPVTEKQFRDIAHLCCVSVFVSDIRVGSDGNLIKALSARADDPNGEWYVTQSWFPLSCFHVGGPVPFKPRIVGE